MGGGSPARGGAQGWADDADALTNDLWVGLRVLVLGPGETGKAAWFEKRRNVIAALSEASCGGDVVQTCEDLFRLQSAPPVEFGYAELAHVDQADIVIALILASPSTQGGVYRELEIIAPYPVFRGKVEIFLPKAKSYLERFQAGQLQVYGESQKVSLSWSVLKDCKLLREMCISRVEEKRKQRMYAKYMARIHARGVG